MFYQGDLICYDEKPTEPKYRQRNKGKRRMMATNDKIESTRSLVE